MTDFIKSFSKYSIERLDNGVKLPQYKPSPDDYSSFNVENNISNRDFLWALIKDGFSKKILTNPNKKDKEKEYQERVDKEFATFEKLGIIDYVLITWDIVNFCKKNKIPIGVGRGSAAGSEVLYLIGITNIDSLEYGCYFERFLNEARSKFKVINGENWYDGSLLLDVDLDVGMHRRNDVVTYIENKYSGKTAKLLTLSTLTTKILIKEVSKILLGISETDANEISESIPKVHGVVKDIDYSYNNSKFFKEFCDKNPDVLVVAKKLHSLIKNTGIHASAIIICDDKINDMIPVQLAKDGEIVTSYEMDDALNLAIKVDVLGLRCADHIWEICKLINIRPEDIDVNCEEIYENLNNLKTPKGLFQIEADCNLGVLKKLKPKNLNHLAAVIACGRPGALEFVDDFAEFIKTGKYQSIHPFFDDCLRDTAGIPIYQESQLRMLNKIGFLLIDCELARRTLGKKKVKEIEEWKIKIAQKIKENKLPEELTEIVCKVIEDSSGYSFNFSHAISYATTSALTIYLKFKYPKEFYFSLLKLSQYESDFIKEISIIQRELAYFGIDLLPPHILKSEMDFSIEGDNIRMGLKNIKGIAEKSIEKLDKFKNKYSNKFEIFKAAEEAGIPISILTSLILVGSLDEELNSSSRSKTVLEAQLWNLLKDKEKELVLSLGEQFNFDLIKIIQHLKTKTDEKGKPTIKESRLNTIRKHYNPYHEMYHFNKKNEKLSMYLHECALLGYAYSVRLIDVYKEVAEDLIDINSVNSTEPNEYVHFVGRVQGVRQDVSKNEKRTRYLKYTIIDEMASCTAMLFNDKIDEHKEENEKIASEGDIVVVRGKKKGDAVFADKIGIQDYSICLKKSELINKDKNNEEVNKTIDN